MIVYLNGTYRPLEETSISPNDRGFVFADGVYEVIRWYKPGFWFQPERHWQRLQKCLQSMRLQVDTTTTNSSSSSSTTSNDNNENKNNDYSYWETIANELITRNHLTMSDSAMVYVQVTRGVAPRNHAFPIVTATTGKEVVPPTVYGFATAIPKLAHLQSAGCHVITVPDERWMRCNIKSIALLPNVLAKQAAAEAGVYEALLVRGDCNGHLTASTTTSSTNGMHNNNGVITEEAVITEGSSTSFMAVLDDNIIVTAPLHGNLVLPGITRQVVLDWLAQEKKFVILEKYLSVTQLPTIQEAMILSTTAEVMPVVQINGQAVGNGEPGPVTRRIQQAFRQQLMDLGKKCQTTTSEMIL